MKYFVRILAFLFIGFGFGYSRDCGDPSKIDDSLKKGCSVGYRIIDYGITDDRSYKFSDDYFFSIFFWFTVSALPLLLVTTLFTNRLIK